jgi:cytochrome c5
VKRIVMAIVVAAAFPAAATDTTPRRAEAAVRETCALCHGPGIGGAPRIGDNRAWQRRARQGLDALVRSADAGKGAMPPRGGVPDLTDAELRAAIALMSGLPDR